MGALSSNIARDAFVGCQLDEDVAGPGDRMGMGDALGGRAFTPISLLLFCLLRKPELARRGCNFEPADTCTDWTLEENLDCGGEGASSRSMLLAAVNKLRSMGMLPADVGSTIVSAPDGVSCIPLYRSRINLASLHSAYCLLMAPPTNNETFWPQQAAGWQQAGLPLLSQ